MNRRLLVSLALAALTFGGAAMAQTKAAKPLTIVVYGGSGNIGSRIVAEAPHAATTSSWWTGTRRPTSRRRA